MLVGYEPAIIIHPNYTVFFNEPVWDSNSSTGHRRHNLNGINRATKAKLSVNAKRKLQKAINYLIYTATEKKVYNPKYEKYYTFKVNFITLTLSSEQIHKDSEITNKLLNQFLIEAKKKWNLNRYVWKSEYQRNGNIHYHILSDVFIPYHELLNCWNRIQNKLGYIDRCKHLKKSKQANSTDIHSIRKIKDVSRYVCKYMVKGIREERLQCNRTQLKLPIKVERKIASVTIGAKQFLRSQVQYSRIWGCSHDLSNIKGAKSQEVDKFIREFERMRDAMKVKELKKDNATIYCYDMFTLNSKDFPTTYNYFNQYLQNTFNYHQQTTIFNDYSPPQYEANYWKHVQKDIEELWK
jgi:hypothetical protein